MTTIISANIVEHKNNWRIQWYKNGVAYPPIVVNRDMLETAAGTVRDGLGNLAEYAADSHSGWGTIPNGTIKEETRKQVRDLLKEIAEAGNVLYFHLFNDVISPDNRNAHAIRDDFRALDQGTWMHINDDCFCHIPWWLVSEVSYADLPVTDDPFEPMSFAKFWGLRYRLTATHKRLSPEGLDRSRSTENFKLLEVVDDKIYQKIYDRAEKSVQKTADYLKDRDVGIARSVAEAKKKWEGMRAHSGLLYFYCHANGTDLSLRNDNLSAEKFEMTFQPSHGPALASDEPPACRVVFLNGCSTAIADGGKGFFSGTSGHGFCGFIGAEAPVPTDFAFRYGCALLHELINSGKPLRDVGYDILQLCWPLSLMYGIYAYPEFHTSGTEIPAPDFMTSNFALAQAGDDVI